MSSASSPHRRLRPAAPALALAALAACNTSAPSPPPPPPSPPAAPAGPILKAPVVVRVATSGPQAVTMTEPTLDLPHRESFTLLDPGKGTRAALRYALAPGTTTFTVESRISSRSLDGGAFGPPVALPAIREAFAVTITADQPHTLALRALPGESAATTPEADAYLSAWRTLLQNRRITVSLDNRGTFTNATFNDDPTTTRSARARTELVQRLLSLTVPLPAEPVAPGATWRVVTILRQGAAYAKQTATYTLTSRTPTTWKLHLKQQRVAEQQRIDDPSLPPSSTADLLALFRSLEGDIDLDPRSPLIAAGSLSFESRFHVKLQLANQRPDQAREQILEDTGTLTLSHQP